MEVAKIMLSVFLGFLFGLIGTRIGKDRETKQKSKAISKLIASIVFNELEATTAVAKGVVNNIKKKNFNINLIDFQNVYSPDPKIIEFVDIGILDSNIINMYVSYKQIIKVCEKYRQSLLQEIKNNNDIPSKYFTYLIGLDAVIKRGINLLNAIQKEYGKIDYTKSILHEEINFNELSKYVGAKIKVKFD